MNEISGLKGQWMFPLSNEKVGGAMKSGELAGAQVPGANPAQGQSSASFIDTLKGALKEVNESQVHVDSLAKDQMAGKSVSLHEVMIAAAKADTSLRTAGAIRNKMVEAYTEIMRMQV